MEAVSNHHECPRCGYSTPYKHNLKPHLTAKKECPPLLSDIDRETLLLQLFPNRHEKDTNAFLCTSCNKKFKTANSLGNHKRLRCKGSTTNEANKIDKVMEELAAVKLELSQLKARSNTGNTTINIYDHPVQNNTVNNTVQIKAFNDIVPPHIENNIKYLDECVYKRDLKELMEKMHFDPEFPEYKSIKKTNKKEKYCLIHDGNRWVVERDDVVIGTLVSKSTNTLVGHYQDREDEIMEWLRVHKPYLIGYVKEFFDTLEHVDLNADEKNKDKKTIQLERKLQEDAKCVLLSNR